MKLQTITLSLLLIASSAPSHGQSFADLDKIAASQGAASPLVYTTTGKEIPRIEPGGFDCDKECAPRNGLPNFFSKINEGKEVVVAFIGGSITQADYGYRLQTSKYIEEAYPRVRFRWINAGVSGTGTELGAFRIGEQVLQHNPDLVFIEFAVNGGEAEAMEGMVRQIIRKNPHTDICLVYTIMQKQIKLYREGEIPPTIQKYDSVAAYYHIPSIHLGMEAIQLEHDNELFSADGIHPSKKGGNLYGSAIARGLRKMEAIRSKSPAHQLPRPLIGERWDEAGMYLPTQIASFDGNWNVIHTEDYPDLAKFGSWFHTLSTSERKGASFSFCFEGDIFGIFDIGCPEAGQLDIRIDASPVKTLNRFNSYCNNRYRGQYNILKLPYGVHKVTIWVSDKNADKRAILGPRQLDDITKYPRKYARSVIYLGRILLRGKPVRPISAP